MYDLETNIVYKTLAHESACTTHCRQTMLVKKNECATANELLKPSKCEAQIDLYIAPIKGVHYIIENL